MIQLMAHSHVLLARHPADFRRGIDGFQALCRDQLKQNPRQDTWFVFLNRNRTQIRLLRYDGNGFWLMTKRLSSGRFSPGAGLLEEPAGVLSARQLSLLLKGLALSDDAHFKKLP